MKATEAGVKEARFQSWKRGNEVYFLREERDDEKGEILKRLKRSD